MKQRFSSGVGCRQAINGRNKPSVGLTAAATNKFRLWNGASQFVNFLAVLILTAILSVSQAEAEELLNVWTVQDLAPRTTLNDISSSSHGFITAGFWAEPLGEDGSYIPHHFVRQSSNGVDWVEYSIPRLTIAFNWGPEAVAEANGTIVVAGGYDRVMSSTNGTDWVERHLGNSNRGRFTDVVFGNGLFAIAGVPQRTGLISSEGGDLTFSRAQILGSKLVFGETNFLTAAGPSVGRSINGTDWQYTAVDVPITALGYGKGLFVMGGNDGSIYSSADGGQTWAKRHSGTNQILAIAYGSGQYLAVGENGTVLSSSNGVAWSKRLLPESVASGSRLFGAAYANGTFLVLGQWINQARPDFILRSINLDLARNNSLLIDPVRSREGFRFKAWLPTNQVARVQVSSDLLQWSDLTMVTNTSANPMLITDPSATNKLAGFYRTLSQ